MGFRVSGWQKRAIFESFRSLERMPFICSAHSLNCMQRTSSICSTTEFFVVCIECLNLWIIFSGSYRFCDPIQESCALFAKSWKIFCRYIETWPREWLVLSPQFWTRYLHEPYSFWEIQLHFQNVQFIINAKLKVCHRIEYTMNQLHTGVRPALLKSIIGQGHPEFSSTRQQDAHEYFLHLISILGLIFGDLTCSIISNIRSLLKLW